MTDRAIAEPVVDVGDARLAYPIQCLRPTHRARAACQRLGVQTVGDFLAHDRNEFLALPNCGERTYRSLAERARDFLSDAEGSAAPTWIEFDRPLEEVVDNPRALRAFRQLQIETVGEFLAAPRAELLSVRGFGERTYWAVRERVMNHATLDPARAILPERVLGVRLDDLELDDVIRNTCLAAGLSDVRDLLVDPRSREVLSPEGCAALRSAIEAELFPQAAADTASVEDQPAASVDGEAARLDQLFARLRSDLANRDYALLEAHLGWDSRPRPLWLLADRVGLPIDEIGPRLESLRRTVQQRAPELCAALREATERELAAFDGVVHSERLASGSSLAVIAARSGDRRLPLRLVAFLWPDRYGQHDGWLCRLGADELAALATRLRSALEDAVVPIRVDELIERLGGLDERATRGVVVKLLRRDPRLAIEIRPDSGEVVTRRDDSLEDRLQDLLEEEGRPQQLDDLRFRYRETFRSCRRARLLDALRSDSRFVEVEPERWSLREFHVDELEILRPAAERLRNRIVEIDRAVRLCELDDAGSLSPRASHLLSDLLRRESGLRYLGRGVFCPPRRLGSTIVDELVADLRRAMGEVPFSRFLQNQSESRRRLVSTLLRSNRLFVSPSPDRVDLLENYPFTPERVRILLRTVDGALEHHGGYASLAQVREAVEAAGLGGAFLSDHLLVDLLRRHGSFELLPDDTIAQRSLGLGSWIRQRAREVIRAAGRGLTPPQILAEDPELAEFEGSLLTLLERDPLLQNVDGLHYDVV